MLKRNLGSSLRRAVVRASSAIVVAMTMSALPAGAQALDIGGIEIHIGQPISDVLASLATYRVVYSDAMGAWTVGQRVGQNYQWLGALWARDGKISSISKYFDLTPASDVARTYTEALNYARERATTSCVAESPTEATDGVVLSIAVWCGQYAISYTFPSRYNDAPTGASISVSVSAPPS